MPEFPLYTRTAHQSDLANGLYFLFTPSWLAGQGWQMACTSCLLPNGTSCLLPHGTSCLLPHGALVRISKCVLPLDFHMVLPVHTCMVPRLVLANGSYSSYSHPHGSLVSISKQSRYFLFILGLLAKAYTAYRHSPLVQTATLSSSRSRFGTLLLQRTLPALACASLGKNSLHT